MSEHSEKVANEALMAMGNREIKSNRAWREECERLRTECLRLNHAEAEAMSVVLSQEGQIERLQAEIDLLHKLLNNAQSNAEYAWKNTYLIDKSRVATEKTLIAVENTRNKRVKET